MKVKIVILSACILIMTPLKVQADKTFSESAEDRSSCYSALIKTIDDQISPLEIYANCKDLWNYRFWGFRFDSRDYKSFAENQISCQKKLIKKLAIEVPGLVIHEACESTDASFQWVFSCSE